MSGKQSKAIHAAAELDGHAPPPWCANPST